MKVLVVHNAYQSHHIGGEDIVVQRELKALRAMLGEDNVFDYIVSNDQIRILKLLGTLWGARKHYQQIKKLVKHHAIDIVHVHNFFPLLTPSVFAGAHDAGAKVIHTLHNFRWWCLSGILHRHFSNCEKCLSKSFGWPAILHGCYRHSRLQSLVGALAFRWYRYKNYLQNIDAYFVLTHFQRDKLISLLPSVKMLLKPNFVEAPKEIISPESKQHYLYVGRLETAKGIDLLLSIWQTLPAHFCLNIIGSGDNNRLQLQYSKENIRFLGKLPHATVLEHMAKAKYLIHPSLTYETFGLTLVEALSQGTPVIALDRGPRREFIQSPKNGLLCQSEDLRKTILDSDSISAIDYAQMSQEAIKSAKPFYANAVIDQQIVLYQQVLGRNTA